MDTAHGRDDAHVAAQNPDTVDQNDLPGTRATFTSGFISCSEATLTSATLHRHPKCSLSK